jgi:hypothetical protein
MFLLQFAKAFFGGSGGYYFMAFQLQDAGQQVAQPFFVVDN